MTDPEFTIKYIESVSDSTKKCEISFFNEDGEKIVIILTLKIYFNYTDPLYSLLNNLDYSCKTHIIIIERKVLDSPIIFENETIYIRTDKHHNEPLIPQYIIYGLINRVFTRMIFSSTMKDNEKYRVESRIWKGKEGCGCNKTGIIQFIKNRKNIQDKDIYWSDEGGECFYHNLILHMKNYTTTIINNNGEKIVFIFRIKIHYSRHGPAITHFIITEREYIHSSNFIEKKSFYSYAMNNIQRLEEKMKYIRSIINSEDQFLDPLIINFINKEISELNDPTKNQKYNNENDIESDFKYF